MLFLDKDKDPMKFMEKANQQSEWIVKMFIKLLVVYCPIMMFGVILIGSIIYSQTVYGIIHTDHVYTMYKIM